MNIVLLKGNLGKNPEIRYTPSGSAVGNCSIATSKKWRDKQTGEMVEKTEWHNLVFFGKTAEVAGEWLQKGSKIFVEGELQTRSWEKEGITRYTTEIVVGKFDMLANIKEKRDTSAQDKPQGQAQPGGAYDDFDDDIPF